MCLKTDKIIQRARRIVAAQLYNGIRCLSGVRIAQTDRLERTVQQGIMSAASHHFHRHAALKHLLVLKAVHRCLFCLAQRLPECIVLLSVHRAVDVIRRALVIAGRKIGTVHIHRFKADNRCRRIIKMQVFMCAELVVNALEQSI